MGRLFRSVVVVALVGVASGASAETPKPVKPTKPVKPEIRDARTAPASKPLTAAELEVVVREAIERGDAKLPRGTSVTRVTSSLPVVVPVGTTKTGLELTPPPRRPGVSSTTAVITFAKGEALLGRSPVTLEITASKDALPEVPKGTPVVLVVRRDGFEITTAGITSEAGDVGEVVSVLLRPSGRSFRAQLVTHERAVAVEDPR